ncbi:FYVE and coiled-coil domain-containing protein 1 [Bagarius yarrelli]|uniref:FYVE and coiled-coil domain-containing protein 1 n=1 Tax=Bagarius yarrelli TaxID=175774 RepID=A0A556U083_BAGYA|nr:FYVE and coiled-coil domain-containing protein 1 [Bagarius yarrelli]
MATAGEGQLQRIIRDLHDAVSELTKEYRESGDPITDDSDNLHKFSYKLEYLLQFDQKEKTTFLGTRKDYWDYFSDCLAKIKGANDGIRFVKSIPELKTSLGKGRAFLRYSLVHQRLADTLQQCLINQRVTSDWYKSRSPFLKSNVTAEIINALYELSEVKFDLASRGHDLDSAWPTFARRTLGMTNSPSHVWKAPSRSSSINSLASSFSQAPEFLCSPEHSFLSEPTEPLSDSVITTMDELRQELDQSELKQRELVEHVQQLGSEATELQEVVSELQRQLDISLAAQSNYQELQLKLEVVTERERTLAQDLEVLRGREAVKEAVYNEIQDKLAAAEKKNEELMAKLDGVLEEKGLRAASKFDSAQKIHDLLDGLKEAEKGRIEAQTLSEEKRMQVERLVEELKIKEQALKDGEKKMAALTEKGTKLMKQVEEQRKAMDNLQEELSVREKEASSLQKDLQDLQRCLQAMEQQAAEEKKKTTEEKAVLQEQLSSLKESLEGQLQKLKAQLKGKETELVSSDKRIQDLEVEAKRIAAEKQGLKGSILKLETSVKDQSMMINEYKEQVTSLTELNNKLLETVKKAEETNEELLESKTVLENNLARLTASEKQLRSQLNDAKVTVDEREQRMREENRNLDEKLQKAVMQVKELESRVHLLEQQNTELREECFKSKDALTAAQEECRKFTDQITDLGSGLEVSRCNEANLALQLREQSSQLEDRERLCEELQERLDELEAQDEELEAGKAAAERALEKQREMMERLEVQKKTVEKAQLEMSACRAKEAQEMALKVALLEEQLSLNAKEVSRIQEERVDLKAKLLSSEEEKVKIHTKLDITEASRLKLETLTEQLKKQADEQNRNHITEILQSKQHIEEISSELKAKKSELAKILEDLVVLKTQNEVLVMENAETREGLHRANTEMAELGMTVCKMTAEREEAQERWAAQTTRLHELEEQAKRQTDRLNASLPALRQENASLREELLQMEKLPKTMLELKEMLEKSESEKDVAHEETAAMRFQISTENISHQNHVKNLNDELESLKAQLKSESEKVSSLEVKVAELEDANSECSRLREEKDSHITRVESLIRRAEDEIQQQKDRVTCMQDALALAQRERDVLKEKLAKVQSDARAERIKMAAEIEDLGNTKTTLEERLIELIRQVQHRLPSFSPLQLCGRIFCYYCSNNFVSTRSGGKKERCCGELTDPDVTNADGLFDIITDEEVTDLYDSDSLSQDREAKSLTTQNLGISAEDTVAEEQEEMPPTVQDAEIHLLTSGELASSVELHMDEIRQFGESPHELFVKSSCYSIVSVTVHEHGHAIGWVFSSEPKSICFSVVYRESMDTPQEQAKVLIPLTRCNAHKEAIAGQLKARTPGVYTLIFDNSYSRYIHTVFKTHSGGDIYTYTTVCASLHPECEYIFQLAREEQLCLREIAQHENLSTSGQTGSVSRNCTSLGWSPPFPPYHEACSIDDDIPEESYFTTVRLIYSIGYGASLISLSVAVVVLLIFRRLHCARNYIHIQLFVSFILKATSVFVKDTTLFGSEETDHCSLSTAGCKASVVFCHYCVMSNFSWLLVEAVYLNSLLLSARSRRCLWGLSLLGWDAGTLMKILLTGGLSKINFLLFLNIVRILVQKLNPRLIQFNNSAQYRRLTKSTLLLIPLFGTHYVVFNFLPDYTNISLRLCLELCLGSFQGLIVAILYCFLNQEVCSSD